MRKHLLGIVLAAIAMGWAGREAVRYLHRRASRLPENSPAYFRPPLDGRKVVVCAGDSITAGIASYDYVALLEKRLAGEGFVYVNGGVGGHLAYNLLARLDEVIACRPDYVTVLIGTNDANATLSPASTAHYVTGYALPARPTAQWYRENMEQIVRRLKHETAASIALLSLPVLGEAPDSVPFKRAQEFSHIVKEVARAADVAYLPLNERQVAYLLKRRHRPGLLSPPSIVRATWILIERSVFGRSFDSISRRNGLLLTTDTIHMNSRGAGMIADLIEGYLRGAGSPRNSPSESP